MSTHHTTGSRADQSTTESVSEFRDERDAQGNPWDTSDPIFSAHTRDVLTLVFKCYFRQLVVLLGVPGNAVCCAVFLKQGLSDRINLLLFSLALADFLNLATQLFFFANCFMDVHQAADWNVVVYTHITYINRWVSFVSGTLIVLVSLDRCLSVTLPLKARRLLTYRKMLAAILVTYAMHLLCYLPSFFLYTVKWRVDPSTNRTMAYQGINDWVSIDTEIFQIFTLLFHLVYKPVSFVVVIVCCIITIVSLRRAARKRLQMTGTAREGEGEGEDTRITKLLLLLCCVYVVLVAPELSASITYKLVPGFFLFQTYHNTFTVLFEVIIFNASCLNSAINFFAYVMLSSKFRKTLKDMCHCPGKRST